MVACGTEDTTTSQGGQENSGNKVNSDNSKVADKGKSHDLIISHFLPGNHVVHTDLLEVFAANLEEQTGGRITSEIYSAGVIGEPGAQYDMAVTGTADITLSVHGFTPGRFPIVSVIELPFFTSSAEVGAEILWTLYNEFPELQEEHADTTPLWLFTAEPAQILSASKPIEKIEDMKGLRVRSPSPFGNQLIEALGGIPISMPMGNVYEALQKGVIDAAMAPFSAANDFNLMEVSEYITVGNFSMTPFFTVMNTDTYNSLSDSDKELLQSLTGSEMAKKSGAAFDFSGNRGIDAGVERGIEFIELTGDKLNPWQEALEPLVEKWISDMEAQGVPGREIYDRAVELGKELN